MSVLRGRSASRPGVVDLTALAGSTAGAPQPSAAVEKLGEVCCLGRPGTKVPFIEKLVPLPCRKREQDRPGPPPGLSRVIADALPVFLLLAVGLGETLLGRYQLELVREQAVTFLLSLKGSLGGLEPSRGDCSRCRP